MTISLFEVPCFSSCVLGSYRCATLSPPAIFERHIHAPQAQTFLPKGRGDSLHPLVAAIISNPSSDACYNSGNIFCPIIFWLDEAPYQKKFAIIAVGLLIGVGLRFFFLDVSRQVRWAAAHLRSCTETVGVTSIVACVEYGTHRG